MQVDVCQWQQEGEMSEDRGGILEVAPTDVAMDWNKREGP